MSVFDKEEVGLPKPNYEYITDGNDVERTLTEILKYDMIEFDTETTGFDPHSKKIVLVQIGIPNKVFVYDVRDDTEHSTVSIHQLAPVLKNKNILKLIQNAVFDMKMMKVHAGYYLENIYDTMLVEQIFNLGASFRGAGLADLVLKYLGLVMPKEPASTFEDYNQTFKPFQLEYAANDVTVLSLIRDLQAPRIKKEGFENVCRLEFEFTKPMCEMELNGITIDEDKWRIIMGDTEKSCIEEASKIQKMLLKNHGQNVLFDVPVININSNKQLLTSLKANGIKLENTDQKTLSKLKNNPIINSLLSYRKTKKLISTYGESLLAKIHSKTGRLHTRFKQMISTGRMSSSSPNLQNIPKQQKYRSCFVSRSGYSLITADMQSAELVILGNLSNDPIFLECFTNGVDLHSRSASEVFNVPIEKVDKTMRDSCKALSFGLMYGLSKYGLAARLDITEKDAQELIDNYFSVFKSVKQHLDQSARDAIKYGYSLEVSGRKRFYNIPPFGHPDRKKIQKSVERQARNMPIQGANSSIIKEAMIIIVNSLERFGDSANLLLTVHDEVIIEVKDEYTDEVSIIIKKAISDGSAKYFSKIKMGSDCLVGPTWLKNECPECKHTHMKLIDDEKYITKLVCAKCNAEQG